MSLWRVKIAVNGILRVEAESTEAAEALVQQETPYFNGRRLFGVTMYAETEGPVENVTLDPQAVIHRTGVTEG